MDERDGPREPEQDLGADADLGDCRGVALDGVISVATVSEPPSTPAQPPAPEPAADDETQ